MDPGDIMFADRRNQAHDLRKPFTLEEMDVEYLPVSKRDIAYEYIQTELCRCQCAREQVGRMYLDFEDSLTPFSRREMSLLFGRCKAAIWNLISKWRTSEDCVSQCGRPKLLTDQQWKKLALHVQLRLDEDDPPTVADLREYIADEFDRHLTCEQVGNMLHYSSHFKSVMAYRMEPGRVHCSAEAIDGWFATMIQAMAFEVPAAFIADVDEVGFGGSKMDKNVHCIVPASYVGQKVGSANEFTIGRSTRIACITADGGTMKPMMVVQRETVDRELRVLGYTDDKICFDHSQTGYITGRIFLHWLKEVYIKDLHRRRTETQYDGPAILIMDGCSCHDRGRIESPLEDENVNVFFLPPHSSDQLQMLDIGIFGIMKRKMAETRTPDKLSCLTRQIVKAYNAWQAVTTPMNVTMAFKRAGFNVMWDEKRRRTYVYKDERTAGAVRHFQQTPEFLIEKDRKRSKL